MRKIVLALAAAAALAACDTPFGTEATRAAAKSVVNGIVEDRFPGVNAAPITDCIIDNASSAELIEIASDAVTGVQDETVVLVFEIAGRPDTIACFADAAGPLLLARILAAS